MKTLGIIGGVSWHSSAEYYQQLNRAVSERLGKRHSARVVLASLDFFDLLQWQKTSDQTVLLNGLLVEANRLKSAGCDGFLIASHTLSWLGPLIEAETGLTHVSLFEAVFRQLRSLGARRMGLIGTQYTMKETLYREIYEKAGFEVFVPQEPHLTQVATIIYKELVQGIFLPQSKNSVLECVDHLGTLGAQVVVLGCTEIGLLIRERHWPQTGSKGNQPIPLIDLIEAHVSASVDWMLE